MNNERNTFINLVNSTNEFLESKNATHGISRVLRTLKKEIAIYEANIIGRETWEKEKFNYTNLTKLQIGSGKHTLEGFLNVDILPPADLICDIREGLPLEDNHFEFIFTEHTFEHLDYPTSLKKVVKDCARVLKTGGTMVLGLPDAELAINCYKNRDIALFQEYMEKWYSKRDCKSDFNTLLDLVNYVFRDQDDSEKYNPHYWAYDFEKIQNMLIEGGFSKIEKWTFDEKLANIKRKFGSVYVIATK